MILRKLGKFLRGKTTPFQIFSATILGGLLGSLPGFMQGPLLMLLLVFLLIILNANLFLGAIALVIAKLLSLLLMPVLFHIGVFLLEGPLSGLVAVFVNAPVTAWFGFDYYVMIPSLLLGLLVGLFLGTGIRRGLTSFRVKMAGLESGSEKYQAYTSKIWIKVLAFVFFGGIKGKKSWTELKEVKGGLPVRPLGVVFVVALCVLGYIGFSLLDETILTANVRDALARANGATVDLSGIRIEPGENRLVVSGLALADPANLENNRFSAKEIIADISGMNLLAKKVVIDSLRIVEPMANTPRRVPGKLTVPPPEPVDEPVEAEDVFNIYDFVEDGDLWRKRFASIKRIYDRIAPHMKGEDEEEADPGEPGWRDRLAEQARVAGYASMKSDSLIRESPVLWIRDLQADNLEVGGNDDLFRISGSNLSTQPALLEVEGQLSISREDDKLQVELGLPSSVSPNRSRLAIRYTDLAVSELEEKAGKDLPMEGGSLDITGEGVIEEAVLDLPLKVVLNDTTLSAFGSSVPLDNFPVEVRVLGPLDRPRLEIPQDALENALKSGAEQKVKGLIEDKVGDQLKGLFE